jgi:uncharacterized protein (DUF2267 family)
MASHVFDPAVATATSWLRQLMKSLELPAGNEHRALHALRAGLHSLRDRLPAEEVVDLGAQLPLVLRGVYYEGWTLHHDPTAIRDRAAMIERVQKELAPDVRLDPVNVLRATIELLVEHISVGEMKDVFTTLPKSIASLWQDLTGHALETLSAKQPQHETYTRRTGYSR